MEGKDINGLKEVTWYVNGAHAWIKKAIPRMLVFVILLSLLIVWDVFYSDGRLALPMIAILIPAVVFGLGIQPFMYPFMIGISLKAIHLKNRRRSAQRIILWEDLGSIIFKTVKGGNRTPLRWKNIRLHFNDGTRKILPLNVSEKIFGQMRDASQRDHPDIFWRNADIV